MTNKYHRLYQFGEVITAGITDPLSRGRAVQPKWSSNAWLGPSRPNGIFDGIENGCRQEERRLANSLVKTQWCEISICMRSCGVTMDLLWRRRWPYHWEHLWAMRRWAGLECRQTPGSYRNLDPVWGGLPEENNGVPLGWRGPDPAWSPPQPVSRRTALIR